MNIANREVDAKALSKALRQSKLFKDKTHTGFVFLDIDETVFTRMNQVLDPSLAETLEDITALGHHIVWITARPCQSRQQTIKDLANLMGRHTAKGVTCKGRSGEANNISLTCTCTQQHRLAEDDDLPSFVLYLTGGHSKGKRAATLLRRLSSSTNVTRPFNVIFADDQPAYLDDFKMHMMHTVSPVLVRSLELFHMM